MAESQQEEILFEQNCNYEQEEGVFRVRRTELEWCSFQFIRDRNIRTSQPTQVVIPLNDLQETLVSRRAPKIMFRVKKDGVDMRYMFEFGTDLSRDQCKDLVNRIFNEFRDRTIPLQVKQKLHILASDPHLKKMHRELVDGGVLSEKEFWESRKQLLVNEAARVDYQQRGVQNDIFAELNRKLVRMQQRNETKIELKLDAATIREIFIAYPHVKKAFDLNVPHKVSEMAFWTRFLQSQYFHRDRGGLTDVSTTMRRSSQQDDMFAGDREMDDSAIQQQYREKLRTMDRFVDIAADESKSQEIGYGVKADEMTAPTRVGGASVLLRKLNTNSARVLEGPHHAPVATTTTAEEKSESEMTEDERLIRNHMVLEDLVQQQRDQFMLLNIQDKHRYLENYAIGQETPSTNVFATKTAIAAKDYSPAELLNAYRDELAELRFDSREAIVDGALAMEISRDIDRQSILAQGSTMYPSNDKKAVQNVPPSFREELNNHFHLLMELLRHFWSCILGPKEMHRKAEKLMQALSKCEQKIASFQSQYRSDADLSNIIKALLQGVTTARERYESQISTPMGMRTPATPVTAADAKTTATQQTTANAPQAPSMGFTGFSLGKSAAPATPAAGAQSQTNNKAFSFSLGGVSASAATPAAGRATPHNNVSAATSGVKPSNTTASIFGDDDDDDDM